MWVHGGSCVRQTKPDAFAQGAGGGCRLQHSHSSRIQRSPSSFPSSCSSCARPLPSRRSMPYLQEKQGKAGQRGGTRWQGVAALARGGRPAAADTRGVGAAPARAKRHAATAHHYSSRALPSLPSDSLVCVLCNEVELHHTRVHQVLRLLQHAGPWLAAELAPASGRKDKTKVGYGSRSAEVCGERAQVRGLCDGLALRGEGREERRRRGGAAPAWLACTRIGELERGRCCQSALYSNSLPLSPRSQRAAACPRLKAVPVWRGASGRSPEPAQLAAAADHNVGLAEG